MKIFHVKSEISVPPLTATTTLTLEKVHKETIKLIHTSGGKSTDKLYLSKSIAT